MLASDDDELTDLSPGETRLISWLPGDVAVEFWLPGLVALDDRAWCPLSDSSRAVGFWVMVKVNFKVKLGGSEGHGFRRLQFSWKKKQGCTFETNDNKLRGKQPGVDQAGPGSKLDSGLASVRPQRGFTRRYRKFLWVEDRSTLDPQTRQPNVAFEHEMTLNDRQCEPRTIDRKTNRQQLKKRSG